MRRYGSYEAEFVGGPWDRKLLAIQEATPEIKVAIAPELSLEVDYAKPVVEAIKTGRYRLVATTTFGGDYWVGRYEWKGVD